MSKTYKIIVAHPDDEIIFFSSILKSASKIIFCFGPAQDKIVSSGREKIKKKLPLNNIFFLNLKEANVFNEANWRDPKINHMGLIVHKNQSMYRQNYINLRSYLSKIINIGDTIYTHNPWGEYGHEDHVLIFNVIQSLKIKFKLKIFVNNYVSNKSYNFMKMCECLLSNITQHKTIDKKFTSKIKKIYISNFCWTFNDDYIWPKKEMFIKINLNNIFKYQKKNTFSGVLNYLPGNYKINFFKVLLAKIIGYKQKKKIQQIINRYKIITLKSKF
jgi:hypothetical protein